MTKIVKGRGVEDVHDSHHEGVGLAADKPGDRPVGDADHQGDKGGHEANHDRYAAAEKDPGKEVAAEVVGAQPVGAARRRRTQVQVDFPVGLREDRAEGAEDRKDGQDAAAEEGQAVAPQPAPGVAPERMALVEGLRGRGAYSNLSFGFRHTWMMSTTRFMITMRAA